MAASFSRSDAQVIPTFWREKILKRDFDIVLGKMLQTVQLQDDETEEPYLRSANIQWTGVDLSDIKTMWFSPQEKESLRLQNGDVLVNEGGDVGRCAIWNGEISECYFQNAVNRVRPTGDGSSRFLYYWLYNIKSSGFIDSIVSKTTIAHLTAEKLETVPWPDVPPYEQSAIAGYLDAHCEKIELAIGIKKKQLDALSGIKRSFLQRVVTRGKEPSPSLISTGNSWLEQLPDGWSLVMLKRLAEIQSGLTLGKVYEDEDVVEYPYLRVANVQDGYVDLDDVSTLEVPPAFAAGVMLRAGDVLMTEGGDLDKLGRGTVWEGQIEPCLHQNHVFAVRCYRHKLLPHYLAYVTAAQYGRDYFEATGKRTTNLAATNSTKVGMFYIPLPPLEEQRELVRYLDTELGRLAAIEANIGKQIDTLLAYRKSLIHECVTGKRRITSADFSESAAHA